MIRFNNISDSRAAASYLGAENAADYYLGQSFPATWKGEASRMIGCHGQSVTEKSLKNMLSNRSPWGDKLKPRDGGLPGYELTFSMGKSISIMHAIAKDPRIVPAFQKAIDATMREVEKDAGYQVRGERALVKTGNIAYATFIHETSRPPKGSRIPDMQLHAHVTVANLTWTGDRYLSLDPIAIKSSMPYYESFFRQKLAEQLQSHGYILKSSGKDFEIEGVPQSAIDKFSNRTKEIEALEKKLAAERGYTSLSPEGKAKLGATSRQKKQTELSAEEVQAAWVSRLTDSEHRAIMQTFHDSMFRDWKPAHKNKEAMDYAFFTHKETYVPIKKLLTTAAYHDVTQTTPDGLKDEINVRMRKGQVLRRNYKDEEYITTRRALDKEMALKDLWKQPTKWDGRKRLTVKRPGISKEAKKIIGSRDRVKSFRGLIGTRYGGVMADVMAALPEAIVLDQPTMDEAIAATLQFPDSEIIIFEEPRKDEPRQNPADTLEDFLGVKPITFSERRFDPMPLITKTISTLTRRTYYERPFDDLSRYSEHERDSHFNPRQYER